MCRQINVYDEFSARIDQYSRKFTSAKKDEVLKRVLDTICPIEPYTDDLSALQEKLKRYQGHYERVQQYRLSVQKYQFINTAKKKINSTEKRIAKLELRRRIEPVVNGILDMEQHWLTDLSPVSEYFFQYNKELPQYKSFEDNLNRAQKHLSFVESWKPSGTKPLAISKAQKRVETKRKSHDTLNEKIGILEEKIQQILNPTRSKFGELRVHFWAQGFLVAPGFLPFAAVFPSDDWVSSNKNVENYPYEELTRNADNLMRKYEVLKNLHDTVKTNCGCVCISWTRLECINRQDCVFYVPALGFSGTGPRYNDPSRLSDALAACALPPYSDIAGKTFNKDLSPHDKSLENGTEKDYTNYYDDIMTRANNLAVNYRVRQMLKMRLPGRQAMLSYLGLNFNTTTRGLPSKDTALCTPSPNIARWHSLNCAEPAALGWISCFFADGQDVILCCPYEGSDNAGKFLIKPKETCPWCATVELAYRSLKKVNDKIEFGQIHSKGMTTGEWDHEITFASEFRNRETDQRIRKNLPRNKEAFEYAYPNASDKLVNENISLLRDLFSELGFLNDETIRIQKEPLWKK
jgi:hypothetical protein